MARVGAISSIAWVAMSLIWFVTSGVIAALLFAPGMWAVVWTLLAAFGVLGAARISFGAWLAVSVPAAAVLVAGVVLSGAVQASLRDWMMLRFGYMEPDSVGITGAFFAVVIGVAVSGFAALVAPRRAVLPPLVAGLGGVVLTALIVIANLPGLSDGLDPESLLPAVMIGAASLYVVAVGAISIRAWRRAG